MFNELRTKRRMEQGASSITISAMEARFNRLVKVVNDATDVATKEMKKSTQDRFVEVSTKLDYL